MNKLFALVMIISLIMGFQNCNQKSLSSSDEFRDVGLPLDPPSTAQKLALTEITSIEIPNLELNSAQRLKVSVQTGSIQLLDELNAVQAQRCLSAASLNELNSILISASVCSAAPKEPNAICGMRYKYPYASIFSDSVALKLGEELDSCGTGSKDLCGEMGSAFKNYISYLKLHWQEMACN